MGKIQALWSGSEMLFGARQLSSSACFSIRTQAQPHLYTRAVHAKSLQLGLTLCDPLVCSPPRLLYPWDFPGKNTGVGCHALLQGCRLCLMSSALAGGFFTTSTAWEAYRVLLRVSSGVTTEGPTREGPGFAEGEFRRDHRGPHYGRCDACMALGAGSPSLASGPRERPGGPSPCGCKSAR